MNRRQALQSLAALAAGRVAAGNGLVDHEEIDRPTAGDYLAGTMTPRYLAVDGWGPFTEFNIGGFDADEQVIEVWGDEYQVNLSQNCEVPEGYGGTYATMDPDDARALAVSLFMAAEEVERREGGGGNAHP